MADLFASSSATLSPCGTYRYQLTRTWNADRPTVCWVMLNPSTADADQDDPTIRRVVGFSKRWGYGGVVVVNLYALRATDPQALWAHPDPVGPSNDEYIVFAAGGRDVVAAWGAQARPERVRQVKLLLGSVAYSVNGLGVTRQGAPRHPLYVRGDTPLIPFPE